MSVPPASKPLATKPRAVVIGAGVAGLAAACLMAKDYDVTVLEKNPRVGRPRGSSPGRRVPVGHRPELAAHARCVQALLPAHGHYHGG